jgi:hypothetical protein
MSIAITINKFSKNDKKIVLDLLSKADLPIADLTTKKMSNFMVARDRDNHILGVVGEEYKNICPVSAVCLFKALDSD